MSHQSRFDAWYWMLGAGALGRPKGMVWGGRREEGSGWGTHVYLHLFRSSREPWLIQILVPRVVLEDIVLMMSFLNWYWSFWNWFTYLIRCYWLSPEAESTELTGVNCLLLLLSRFSRVWLFRDMQNIYFDYSTHLHLRSLLISMIPLPFTLLFWVRVYTPFLCFLSRDDSLALLESWFGGSEFSQLLLVCKAFDFSFIFEWDPCWVQ